MGAFGRDSPNCLCMHGFSQFAMEYLAESRVVKIRGRIAGAIGQHGTGLPKERTHACIDRMRCWLILCDAVIDAEFQSLSLCRHSRLSSWPWTVRG